MPRKTNRNAQGAGTIRQRKDGTWEARYTLGRDPGTGKQVQKSIYGKTQADVRKKLQKFCTEIDEGMYMEPSKFTVEQWADIWISEYCGHLKPGTLSLYKRQIKNYVKPHLAKVKLSALKPHTLQTLYNRFQNGSEGVALLKPCTIKNVHGVIHKMMEQALELGYIRINPSNACKLPRLEKPEINPMDELQTGTFLTSIQGHQFETFYLVDLFTGLRQSELLGLTWDCVDFEKGKLFIYRQLQLIDGEYQFGTLKNDKTRRITPAPFVMETLRKQQQAQNEWKRAAGALWVDDGFVFTDELGAHLARQTTYKQYKKVVADIGLPKLRFHDLRHSYAVAAIRAGDDIKTIQENLGHHAAAFTLDVYGHVTEQMRQDSANRMEEYIKGIKGDDKP
ncbi:site-specific integrase [Eubacteriales bacterium OttesenSCG-928-A19]|nr:site-specific integrase [Eubacteriales bacterium OttesenSCG-928-A19]